MFKMLLDVVVRQSAYLSGNDDQKYGAIMGLKIVMLCAYFGSKYLNNFQTIFGANLTKNDVSRVKCQPFSISN